MSLIQGFKRTHVRKSYNGALVPYMVGVVDRSEGRVFFAGGPDEGVHSMSADDFNKRYSAL